MTGITDRTLSCLDGIDADRSDLSCLTACTPTQRRTEAENGGEYDLALLIAAPSAIFDWVITK
ncbi:MAG: hypothetical protein LBR98_00110 [Syntrophomonadaceae bacterium]|jgi:hypothetical protein|nr:hypothetical protein [Syntrophomonadaceae bacterium]